MIYMDFPFADVVKMWVAQGGTVQELIEPIDGYVIKQQTQ